jgi:lipopolysaccharide/colanic/teichoic acid biosynthesis glycosyltransferase
MIYLAINISVMFSTLSLRTLSELTCTSVLLVIFGYYAECAVRKFLVRKQLLGAPTLLVGRRGDHGLVEVQATLPEAGFRPIGFVECKGDTIARDLHAPSFFASSGKDPSAIDDSEVTLLLAHDQAISEGGAGLKGLPFAHVVLLPEVGDKLSTVGVPVHLFEGVTGFEVTQTIHKSGSLFVKRGVDLLLGTPLLILAAPIILISAVAVKIIDPGPGLYQQQRVGKDGRLIKVPKLRTMYANAEALLQEHLSKDPAARLEWEKYCKLSNDPRVLPFIGTFLRRTSLDELPQLFNAVAGTMSLVGPRPFPEYHLDRFDDAFRTMRMSVPPGLTGFWQVSARSDGDLCIQKIQDTYYIQNWSIWLDLWILLQTVPAVIAGRGAR